MPWVYHTYTLKKKNILNRVKFRHSKFGRIFCTWCFADFLQADQRIFTDFPRIFRCRAWCRWSCTWRRWAPACRRGRAPSVWCHQILPENGNNRVYEFGSCSCSCSCSCSWHLRHWLQFWQWEPEFMTIIVYLTNKFWHWTAFAILVMFWYFSIFENVYLFQKHHKNWEYCPCRRRLMITK